MWSGDEIGALVFLAIFVGAAVIGSVLYCIYSVSKSSEEEEVKRKEKEKRDSRMETLTKLEIETRKAQLEYYKKQLEQLEKDLEEEK